MRKFLLLGALLLTPLSAHADFNMVRAADMSKGAAERTGPTSSTAVKPVSIPRQKMRPSLEVLNERYVPEEVKQKYKMTDDYVEMTQAKPDAPIVVEPAPPAVAQKKKRLEIIGGPPPVMPVIVKDDVAPTQPPQMAEVKAAPIPVPAERIETWRARKGEFLKDVLKRWSDRAGTDFVWTAAESPKISSEYSYMGTFDKAVAGLMKQDSGSLKMKYSEDDGSVAAPPVSAPVPITGENNGSEMRAAPAVVAPVGPAKSWFAASGASLQGVLHAWAETEGASLVWQADPSLAVSDTINEKGSFEEAVEKLLSKYEGKKLRPVGQLYKNPVSGEKVLVIKTDLSK